MSAHVGMSEIASETLAYASQFFHMDFMKTSAAIKWSDIKLMLLQWITDFQWIIERCIWLP